MFRARGGGLMLSLVSYLLRFGDWEGDRLVEIVDTELDEKVDAERARFAAYPWPPEVSSSSSISLFRSRSFSLFASSSSATPFLNIENVSSNIYVGPDYSWTYVREMSWCTSLVSCGTSFGFWSCCVRDGRDL